MSSPILGLFCLFISVSAAAQALEPEIKPDPNKQPSIVLKIIESIASSDSGSRISSRTTKPVESFDSSQKRSESRECSDSTRTRATFLEKTAVSIKIV